MNHLIFNLGKWMYYFDHHLLLYIYIYIYIKKSIILIIYHVFTSAS